MKRQYVPVRPRGPKRGHEDLPEVEVVESQEAELMEAVDDVLDEIDSVLEEQAVLVDYRQKSGQ